MSTRFQGQQNFYEPVNWGYGFVMRRLIFGLVFFSIAVQAQQILIPFNKDGIFGYVNEHGLVVLSPSFESADVFVGGVGVVKQNGKYGTIDEKGNWIVKPAYDDIWVNARDSVLTVRRGNSKGFLRLNGQAITPVKYYSVDGFSWGVARVFQFTSHPQAVNKEGKELIPATHYFEGQPHRGFMKVYDRKTEKAGIIDSTGKFYLPCLYDEISLEAAEIGKFIVMNRSLSDAGVELKNYGMVGAGGKEIIPVRFKEIRYLRDGLFAVKVESKWGLIDEKGDVLLEDNYLDIRSAQPGYFFFASLTSEGMAFGLMNKNLEVVLEPLCKDVKTCYKDCFVCLKKTGWGVVSIHGKTIVPFEYWMDYGTIGGNPYNYHELYIWAEKDNNCYLFERDGRFLATFSNVKFLFIHENGLISYDDPSKKRMLFSKYGAQLLPAEYGSYINFDKLIFLKKVSDHKWYAVNEKGEIINQPYDEIDEFSRVYNFIKVRRDNQYFYMDSSGKEYVVN